MSSRHRGLPVVKCLVSGKRMNCLLDSGSDITYVPPLIGLRTSVKKFAVKSSIGTTQLPEAHATIQVGRATVTIVVLVQKLPSFMPFDAILGENFLRAFKQVSFDYAHDTILLGAPREANTRSDDSGSP